MKFKSKEGQREWILNKIHEMDKIDPNSPTRDEWNFIMKDGSIKNISEIVHERFGKIESK